ncbi:MAG: hypothetical protein ABSB74_17850 [Tepidisphaeraceae bacterium]
MFRKNRIFLAWGVGLVWASVTITGFASLWRYENTSGAQPEFSSQWPAASRIPLDAHHPTLVVFMHPQCPCSKASVAELTRVMTHCQGRLIARVLFIRPAGFPAGWEQTELWRDAAAIPGTFVSCDPNGVEAKLFGARTSGQTALYDPAGHLLFQGGITESRGDSGDNAGCDAIVDFVLHPNRAAVPTTRSETAVFGCSLFSAPSPTEAGSNTR